MFASTAIGGSTCSRGGLLEIDERLLVEKLDLPAGFDDRGRTGMRARAVGDGFLQRPGQDQRFGRIDAGRRKAEELSGVHSTN